MSRTYKSNAGNTFAKMLSVILVLLLVAGAAGLIAFFVLQEQGVSFYVAYKDTRYYSNADGGSLQLVSGTHDFSVRSLTGEDVNYTVRVTSNSANNFDFVFEDEYWKFYDQDESKNDYSDIFSVKKSADGFSLTIPDMTIEQIVEEQFGGEIELVDEIESNAAYFLLTVTAGESVVQLWFSLPEMLIELDPPAIVF